MTKLLTTALLAGLLCGAGCLKETAPVAEVSHAPLVVDEAMQRRAWPRTVARFANGETVAWPTAFVLEHRPDAPRWAPVLTDGPLFLANVIAMPIGYAFTPAWTPVTYPNGTIEPSYNAMPPLKKE